MCHELLVYCVLFCLCVCCIFHSKNNKNKDDKSVSLLCYFYAINNVFDKYQIKKVKGQQRETNNHSERALKRAVTMRLMIQYVKQYTIEANNT